MSLDIAAYTVGDRRRREDSMPDVVARTRRKFRGLARARIQGGKDFLNRLLNYNESHPDKELFDGADVTIVNQVITTLQAALDATIPVS
jgi:hypothetical protein